MHTTLSPHYLHCLPAYTDREPHLEDPTAVENEPKKQRKNLREYSPWDPDWHFATDGTAYGSGPLMPLFAKILVGTAALLKLFLLWKRKGKVTAVSHCGADLA